MKVAEYMRMQFLEQFFLVQNNETTDEPGTSALLADPLSLRILC